MCPAASLAAAQVELNLMDQDRPRPSVWDGCTNLPFTFDRVVLASKACLLPFYGTSSERLGESAPLQLSPHDKASGNNHDADATVLKGVDRLGIRMRGG